MQQGLLPLFPLSVVLLPGTPLPLHIFEDRYREMIGEALQRDEEFGVVQARDNGILRVGCTAAIEKVLQRYDDGRLDILTYGRRRFEIDSVSTERSFLQAEVTYFDDDDHTPPALGASRRAMAAFRAWLKASEEEAEVPDEDDPQLSFLLGHASNDLDFRQMLLTIRSEAERMKRVGEHLELLITRQKLQAGARKSASLNGHGRRPHDLSGTQ